MNGFSAVSSSRIFVSSPHKSLPLKEIRAHLRLIIVASFLLLLFLVLIGKLTAIMLLSESREMTPAQALGLPLITRANIVDRQGQILATNLATGSLYANPKEILDVEEVVVKLTGLFPDINPLTLRENLLSGKSFIWIKRNLTPAQQKAVQYLGLPGVAFIREERRTYPFGEATGHVVGFTNLDLEGISGIERAHEEQLVGGGKALQLSLDIRVQNVLRDALLKHMKVFQAKAGSGIIMNVKTGEILAMVSLPDFNPHTPGDSPQENLFNINTLGLYEMGSLFKVFTIAMALDTKKVSLNDGFDATHNFKVGKFSISDFRGKRRWLTIPEIFMYSSNIGTIKIMLEVGKEAQLAFFDRIGFFKPVPINFGELAQPTPPAQWTEASAITASYGYGVAVSPLHVISALSAIINDGIQVTPTFLKHTGPISGKRVISSQTSDKMRRLLHLTVKQGTSRKADVVGYLVGGKTGSANKVVNGRYNTKEHLASAVSAFPMTDPQYIMVVTLDAPKGTKETFGYATGGWTAAPIVQDVIKAAGPILGVVPLDESRKDIRQAMYIKVNAGDAQSTFG